MVNLNTDVAKVIFSRKVFWDLIYLLFSPFNLFQLRISVVG